jgi:hypothetical protein
MFTNTSLKGHLDERAMLVRKAEVTPIEAIVRGYLMMATHIYLSFLGPASVEYQKTIHGTLPPAGLLDWISKIVRAALYTFEQGNTTRTSHPKEVSIAFRSSDRLLI